MAYSLVTLTNDIIGVTHGTTVYKIPNLYGIFNRAARQLLLDVDPKETMRTVTLPQVFNSVYDYALPSDVKGDRIIDIRPQAGRTASDVYVQDYARTFDSMKSYGLSNAIYTQWNTGVKTIRIEAPSVTSPVTLSDTSSLSYWTAGGGATTLTLNTTTNVAGGGALQFNLSAGQSTAYVEAITLPAVNLSSYTNIAYGYAWVFLPLGTAVTSIDLRWGSSTTAYYNYTATSTQQGNSFQTGWNIIAFPWQSATVTGTPNSAAILYSRVTVNYNSTLQTGVQVCNITFNLGKYFEVLYYSKFLFRDPATNTFQETVVDAPTDQNKIINLDTESYNLYFNKVAFYVAQQLQGADSEYDAIFWDNEYNMALQRYKALNPSEAMIKGEQYYAIRKKGYNK